MQRSFTKEARPTSLFRLKSRYSFVLATACLICTLISGPIRGEEEVMSITIESEAFKANEPIPKKYSGYGDNLSPALSWSGVPDEAKELALICDDPEAPTPKPFVHWVIYKIPAGARVLPEAVPTDAKLNKPDAIAGALQGMHGFSDTGYYGPQPPDDGKTHTYHFKLYALDTELELAEKASKEDLLEAMEGHIVAEGELVGTYKYE